MYTGLKGFAKGIAFATRIGLELVIVVAVGAILGYGVDYWLGSAPWAMIIGLFLGGIAGMLNVYREAMRHGS